MTLKCELYHDSFQNFRGYHIPKAQLVIADIPYCYDEETECWTTNGWKKYTELTLQDTVMSLNPVTQEIKYSGIDKIIIRDNDEEMIRFHNMNLDLFVTENHRMFVKSNRKRQGIGLRNVRYSSEDCIRLAKNVQQNWYIPRSGYFYNSLSNINEIVIPSCELKNQKYIIPEKHIPLTIWLPFFGLWLADGCTCDAVGDNGRQLYTISIKQAGEKRKIVMKMLEDFPYKATEYVNKGTDKSNINIFSKQLWLYLKQFGKSRDKFIPQWIKDLPVEYLKLFWEWYTFGDSAKNGDGLNISTVSEQLILDLQEVALKLGTICQIRKQTHKDWENTVLYKFQYNPDSRNIVYSGKENVSNYHGKVWCITLKTNSVFLVRRNGLIAFCGNCVKDSFYGSNPTWYVDGDNKNGESDKAGKAAFFTDYNFNLVEYFHFCSKLLIKEPKERGKSPCMIMFCSYQQQQMVIETAKKHGFINYIPLVFVKHTSPQVLKANMRICGATEYALVLYRDKLPKFNNNGHMILNWFEWQKDGANIPRIHPTQKPIKVLQKLISIFTDKGDVVIDPCAGSGSTLRAAHDLGRNAFGFEVYKDFYNRAVNEMLNFEDQPKTFFDYLEEQNLQKNSKN